MNPSRAVTAALSSFLLSFLVSTTLDAASAQALAGPADVSIGITAAPTNVAAGTHVAYTITVTNNSANVATALTLKDPLPYGTSFMSDVVPAGWSCSASSIDQTLTCTSPTLAAGASSVFTVDSLVFPETAAGPLVNTATITSANDPNPANNSASVTITVFQTADLAITAQANAWQITPGDRLTYQMTILNNGPSTTNAVMTDVIPAGLTFVDISTSNGWSCSLTPNGTTSTVTCNMAYAPSRSPQYLFLTLQSSPTAVPGTTYTNTMTMSSSVPDFYPTNDSVTITQTMANGPADMSVTIADAPDPVAPGGNITYTLTAANLGPTTATNVTVTDPLPAGTTFVSLASPAGWSCTTPAVGAAGTVTCSIPVLAYGSANLSLVVKTSSAAAIGSTLTNTASINAPNPEVQQANNDASATTTFAALPAITGTKTVTGSFTPAGMVTYTIALHNSGGVAQPDNPGNELTDVLPPALHLLSATATSGTALATNATNTVTWNGSIAAGATVTITITAVVDPSAQGGSTISNQATFNYDADGNGTNETSGVTDDPNTPGSSNATGFAVAAVATTNVPTLGESALLALAVALAAVGALVVNRRA